jgi:hypothetical protein
LHSARERSLKSLELDGFDQMIVETNRPSSFAVFGLTVSCQRDEAQALWGEFLTAFVLFENRPSNRKAVQQLGWQPKGVDMLTDIRSGSYRETAEKLRHGQ